MQIWVTREGARIALVIHLKGWGVFRPRLPAVVKARRRNVGMAEPFLNFGDVGLVLEGVGGPRPVRLFLGRRARL